MPVWLRVPMHRHVQAWGGPSSPGLLLNLAHSVNQPWDASSARSHALLSYVGAGGPAGLLMPIQQVILPTEPSPQPFMF